VQIPSSLPAPAASANTPYARSPGQPSGADPGIAAPPQDPADKSVADEIAEEKRKVAAYKAQHHRELEARRRNGEDVPDLMMALPVDKNGYMPFVTADQLKQIDAVAERYRGETDPKIFARMWDDLAALGLHPDQLARSAKFLVDMDGNVVTRAQATRPVDRQA
jgi:hypothetical protein